MSNESNWAGNIGAQNPGQGPDYFKRQGMSDTQAAEAAAAAARGKK